MRIQKRGVGALQQVPGELWRPVREDLEMGEPGAGHLEARGAVHWDGKVGCLCGEMSSRHPQERAACCRRCSDACQTRKLEQ